MYSHPIIRPPSYYLQQRLVPNPHIFPSLPVDPSLILPKRHNAVFIQSEKYFSTFSLWSVRGIGVEEEDFLDQLEFKIYNWRKQGLNPRLRKKDSYLMGRKEFAAFVEFPGNVNFGKTLSNC